MTNHIQDHHHTVISIIYLIKCETGTSPPDDVRDAIAEIEAKKPT